MKKPLLIIIAVLTLLSGACRAAVTSHKTGDGLRIEAPGYTFYYEYGSGTWSAWWPDGRPMVARAYASWSLTRGDDGAMVYSAGNKKRDVNLHRFLDPYGRGLALDVGFDADGPARFATRFRFFEDLPYFTIQCEVANLSADVFTVSQINPIRADADHKGALFVGPDSDKSWILENGHKLYFDFWVRLIPGSENSDSNWNMAIHDFETSRTAVLGFLTFDVGLVRVLTHSGGERVADEASGWRGFAGARAFTEYTPPKKVKPGAALRSELLAVFPDMDSPHRALEAFANAVAAHYPPTFQGKPVPTGWNAWATHLHHDLTQKNMLQNAKWAARHLKPFGMTTFQIDDGWQIQHGDWEPGNNFSYGMNYMAKTLREEYGFTPGLWIRPFDASMESQLARDHPDWFAAKRLEGEQLMPKDLLILDPTNPDAAAWLRALFNKISNEWGFKVIKIDFIYYLLLGGKFHDPDVTALEAYREGRRIIREAAGNDAFIFDVAVPVYTSVGFMDGVRLGLDITPNWGDEEGPYTQGVKPLYRNLARRYYFNRRLWIAHPDMFYLGSPEEMQRWGIQATMDEARMYGTVVALTGSITKIGDEFIGLNDEQLMFLRQLLPVYEGDARPLDLFEMQYPQVWDLKVDSAGCRNGEPLPCAPQPAHGRRQCLEPWHAVGVFNWGKNRRLGVLIEEGPITVDVRGVNLGLDPQQTYVVYGLWSRKFYGEFKGDAVISVPLDARKCDVLAIRRRLERPMFLSTNRHVTQGGTDIESAAWDKAGATLHITQKLHKDFPYEFIVYLPEGYKFVSAQVEDVPMKAAAEEGIVRIQYKPVFSEFKTWTAVFEK